MPIWRPQTWKPPQGTSLGAAAGALGFATGGVFPLNEGGGGTVRNAGPAPVSGTLTGEPEWSGGAVVCDGAIRYIDMGSVVFGPSATLAVLVTPTAYPSAYAGIACQGTTSAHFCIYLKSNGSLAVYINPGTGENEYDGIGAHTLAIGHPVWVSASYDAVHGLEGYVGGQADGSAGAVGSLSAAPAAFQIGNDPNYADRVLSGLIGAVLYAPASLSAAQHAELFSSPDAIWPLLFDERPYYRLIRSSRSVVVPFWHLFAGANATTTDTL